MTANLLLRPSSQPSRDPRRVARSGAGPERPRERHGAVLAGPRSTAPPRHASRARCFRPCAEPATMPLTPSVATLREFPSRRTARPGRPRRLVKDDSSRRARAPSIERVLSPPVARLAFASACVGSRRARHRCRCSRARGFRHCDPASGAFSPLEPSHVEFARWQGARPMAFWAGPSAARRLLQPRQPASTPLASPDLRSPRDTSLRSPASLPRDRVAAPALGRSLARRRIHHLKNEWRRRSSR